MIEKNGPQHRRPILELDHVMGRWCDNWHYELEGVLGEAPMLRHPDIRSACASRLECLTPCVRNPRCKNGRHPRDFTTAEWSQHWPHWYQPNCNQRYFSHPTMLAAYRCRSLQSGSVIIWYIVVFQVLTFH